MSGSRVQATWEPGSPISFVNTFNHKVYQGRGTVLAVEPGKLLKYSQWNRISHLVDSPENRTVIRLDLELIGEKTRLSVRHDHFSSDAEYRHANFFWGFALTYIKNLVELGRIVEDENNLGPQAF
jgi:hypothetical protein